MQESDPENDFVDIDGVPPAQLRPDKVYDFYLTTVGGLEEVVERDLRYNLKGLSRTRIDSGGRLGRLFFRYEQSPARLLDIRSSERIFAFLGSFRGVTVGQPGLVRIAERVLEADLVPAVALHDILHGPKEEARFSLTCTVSGDHRFSSSEVHQIVQTVMEAKYEVYPEEEGAPYRLHLQVLGKRALFGLELSGPDAEERQAQVPRSLAYCMGLLAKVGERDVCLDPFPGDGSLMREIGNAFGPKEMLSGCPEVKDGGIDRILTVPGGSEVRGRELSLLQDWSRLLAPNRTATVVVEDRVALEEAAKATPFQVTQKVGVRLKGRTHTVVILKRI